MNVHYFDSKQCERIRLHLDAYLSNELLVETTSEIVRHLETCEACSRELEARARVRNALRKAAMSQMPPPELLPSIQRELRKMQPGGFAEWFGLRLVPVLAALALVILGAASAREWIVIRRGRQLVANVLAVGVSDHVQCAIKGHNYPDVPAPIDSLRKKLGPQYIGLLDVVRQSLPGFELLEAHICSIPGSPRQYVHFITRGRGTILSIILTRTNGEQLPNRIGVRSGTSHGVSLYSARIEGMNAAGFATREYWGFVVSDLSMSTTLQIADNLAPPLKSVLDASAWNGGVDRGIGSVAALVRKIMSQI